MTDESKKPEDEPKPEDAKAAASSTLSDAKPVDSDPLPDIIERTPEYVEEEAQRADFVIRWAIILLAMMLGFARTNDARVLVHAKSGEYMQNNGFLPPQVDVFSYAAEGKPWIQLSWLFDHVCAFMYSMVGVNGFTILSSLFAALAFGFAAHTAMPRLSSWWSSICIAFALMACYPRFTPTPEVLTLMFTAITLKWLYKWQTTDSAGFPWKIPVLFVVWANCDPRMWIGVFMITLYAIGHAVDRVLNRNGWTLAGRTGQVWMLLGLCVVAALCNPFLQESLLEPVRQYGVEYPAMRAESNLRELNASAATEWVLSPYSLLKPEVWMSRQKTIIAGTIVLLVALGAFIVNIKNMDTGYFLMLLGFVTLAALAAHELAVASLVAAVLAGLNGQDWFRNNFRTDYTTDVKSFVFSQGGRALTVFALFGFAFLGVSGRLTGPEGVRIGTGLDANYTVAVQGMEAALADVEDDARVFNFKPYQGDMLIWLGKKSYIDSRHGLFGVGDGSISAEHRRTRLSFRKERRGRPATGNVKDWKDTLKKYEIDYVAPRLYGRSGDYMTYFDLLKSERWALATIQSSVAFFKPREIGDAKSGLSFRKLGLQTDLREAPDRLDWARAPDFYDEFIFVPKSIRRGESQLAVHMQKHLGPMPVPDEGIVLQDMDELVGASYLTLRKAAQALAIDPNDDRAYRAMGEAYEKIRTVEEQVARQLGGTYPRKLRMRESIAAFRQSLTANPNQADLCFKLSDLYRSLNQNELALEMLSQGLEIIDTEENLAKADMEDAIDRLSKQRNTLRDDLNRSREQVMKFRLEQKQRMQAQPGQELSPMQITAELLQFCSQIMSPQAGGLTLLAQETLDTEMSAVQGSPEVMQFYGQLLMDNGNYEDSDRLFRELQTLAEQKPDATARLNWEDDAAAIALIAGDSKRAVDILESKFVRLSEASDAPVMGLSMLQRLPLLGFADAWPSVQTDSLRRILVDAPGAQAEVRFRMAVAFLESGRTNAAADLLRSLIEDSPTSPIAPLARYYYGLTAESRVNHAFDDGFIPLDFKVESTDEAAAGSETNEAAKEGEPVPDQPKEKEEEEQGEAAAAPANDDKDK